jgi:putative ABC transport system ATP-binding protein
MTCFPLPFEKMIGVPSPEMIHMIEKVIDTRLGPDYDWPGNVRELEQCVRRVILSRGYEGDRVMPDANDLASHLKAGYRDRQPGCPAAAERLLLMLYRRFGTFEEVARRTNLDRRTVKNISKSGRMIQIRNLHKTYTMGKNALHVLKGIDLSIAQGEMVSIMGSSGSGKSTLLNVIGLLDAYDDGEYYLNDALIKGLSESRSAHLRNRFFGFVFQAFNLISFKNALENVALPLYYQNVGRKKRNRIALEYMEKMGMRDWAEHMPSELSGGQQQRVAIARAMISRPKVILADEPTGALDTETSYEVMDLFQAINADGVTVVIVTHEHDIAARTRRTIRLQDGRIMSQG